MAANDVYEIIIKGICAGQTILNIMHFIDVIGTGDLADWVTHWEDTGTQPPNGELLAFLCTDYTGVEYLAKKVFPLPEGPQIPLTRDTAGGGRATASHLPASAVIKWTTAVGGRSGRGRNYYGPLSQQDMQDGEIIAGMPAQIGEFRDRVLEVFSAAGALYDGHWLFAIFSPILAAANAVTGGQVRTQIKTQRRRQLGVGI